MAINALESGDAIDVAHVRERSRLHPRCGTGFLVVVALVSVGVFAPLGLLPTAVRLVCQIVLVPVVAAVSYEIIRAPRPGPHHAAGPDRAGAGARHAAAQHPPPGRCADRGCHRRARCRARPATASSSSRPERAERVAMTEMTRSSSASRRSKHATPSWESCSARRTHTRTSSASSSCPASRRSCARSSRPRVAGARRRTAAREAEEMARAETDPQMVAMAEEEHQHAARCRRGASTSSCAPCC